MQQRPRYSRKQTSCSVFKFKNNPRVLHKLFELQKICILFSYKMEYRDATSATLNTFCWIKYLSANQKLFFLWLPWDTLIFRDLRRKQSNHNETDFSQINAAINLAYPAIQYVITRIQIKIDVILEEHLEKNEHLAKRWCSDKQSKQKIFQKRFNQKNCVTHMAQNPYSGEVYLY